MGAGHMSTLEPSRPGRTENQLLTRWIADHLEVAIAPFDDRDALNCVESEVLRKIDPPCNIDENRPVNAFRKRLRDLRNSLRRG